MRVPRLYFIFWALLLSIFALHTAPGLWRDLQRGEILRPSPNASMDHYLEALLRIPQASERLNQIFAQWPADRTLLFVSAKGDDRWDFVYSAVCYLSWPRQIDRVELPPGEKFNRDVPVETPVIFCGMPAPVEARDRIALGPHLILLP